MTSTLFTSVISTKDPGRYCVPGSPVEDPIPDGGLVINAPGAEPTHFPWWEITLKVAFYIPVMIIAIGGNIIVVLIVLLNKKLRSTTNMFVMNLALSDLLVAFFCMWVHLGRRITPEWPFGPVICKMANFVQVTAVTASIFFLIAIATDRFFSIVYPLRARRGRSWVGVVSMGCVWVCAMCVAMPYPFVMRLYEIQWTNRREVWCQEVWPKVYKADCTVTEQHSRKIYLYVTVIVLYFLPILVMAVTYAMIGKTLWNRRVPGEQTDKSLLMQQKSKRKVIRMLVVVLAAFFVCWTPFQIYQLYAVNRPQRSAENWELSWSYAVLFLAYSNSALNPVIYAGLNENFRQGFRNVFKGKIGFKIKVHPETTAWTVQTARPNRNDNVTSLRPGTVGDQN